jgi:hypothetical protein
MDAAIIITKTPEFYRAQSFNVKADIGYTMRNG